MEFLRQVLGQLFPRLSWVVGRHWWRLFYPPSHYSNRCFQVLLIPLMSSGMTSEKLFSHRSILEFMNTKSRSDFRTSRNCLLEVVWEESIGTTNTRLQDSFSSWIKTVKSIWFGYKIAPCFTTKQLLRTRTETIRNRKFDQIHQQYRNVRNTNRKLENGIPSTSFPNNEERFWCDEQGRFTLVVLDIQVAEPGLDQLSHRTRVSHFSVRVSWSHFLQFRRSTVNSCSFSEHNRQTIGNSTTQVRIARKPKSLPTNSKAR